MTSSLSSFRYCSAILLLNFILAISPGARGAVIHVPADHATIQAALDASADGDEIVVAPGVYTGQINFKGRDVVLRSSDPRTTATVDATEIRSTAGPIVTFSGAETDACALLGFTITGANTMATVSAIEGNGTRAAIGFNVVRNNFSGVDYVFGAVIQNVQGVIHNNTFRNNEAFSSGSVLYECNGMIVNNLIVRNGDGSPYNIHGLQNCHGLIANNTIAFNKSKGIDACNGIIVNCIVWGNGGDEVSASSSTPYYSCIEGWAGGGAANISADPMFADALAGDYHLTSSSLCINAGNVEYLMAGFLADMDGEARMAGAAVDIGADETDSEPDTDGDLLSDAEEAARETNPLLADTDGDGLGDGREVMRASNPRAADAAAEWIVGPGDRLQRVAFLAFPGEAIIVPLGVWTENLYLHGKPFKIESTDPSDPDVVAITIIDGGGLAPAITLGKNYGYQQVIRGLTIRNGRGYEGGGVSGNLADVVFERNTLISNTALRSGGGAARLTGILARNTITSNTAELQGGGLAYCGGYIEDNLIRWNSTLYEYSDGGGMAYCLGAIRRNQIQDNSSTRFGGGMIYCCGPIVDNVISGNICKGDFIGNGGGAAFCGPLFERNWVVWNQAFNYGGGLYNIWGDVFNNIFAFNIAGNGGGTYSGGSINYNNTYYGNMANDTAGGAWGSVYNAILWANSAPNSPQLGIGSAYYSCVQNISVGFSTNINDDPMFVNAAGGNFNLSPGSPCIDAGRNVYGLGPDRTGDERPLDGGHPERGDSHGFDMGADEWRDPALPAPVPTPAPPAWPASGGRVIRVPWDIKTIHAAIDGAPSGAEIVVYPGWEELSAGPFRSFEPGTIRFSGKDVTVRSLNPFDREIVKGTYLIHSDYQSNDLFYKELVEFSGVESENCRLAGFRFKNRFSTFGSYFARAITGNGTKATIEHNLFEDMFYKQTGFGDDEEGSCIQDADGAIQFNVFAYNGEVGCLALCDGMIRYNQFFHNYGYSTYSTAYKCNGSIYGNLFYSNSSSSGYLMESCGAEIRNNVFMDNGGRSLVACSGPITNNTFYRNGTNPSDDLMFRATGLIQNNIVWEQKMPPANVFVESSTPDWNCIEGWAGGGTGNIAADPKLTFTYWGEMAMAVDSPVIDAGNPAAEWDDAHRPPAMGTARNDMGAFGGPWNAPLDFVDVNELIDFILGRGSFLSAWHRVLADRNGDGALDVADALLLLPNPND